MRLIAAALMISIAPCAAAERQVTFTDEELKIVAPMPNTLKFCVGTEVVDRDVGCFQDLAKTLGGLVNKILSAPVAQPKAADPTKAAPGTPAVPAPTNTPPTNNSQDDGS